MEEISLHILDLTENSVKAGAGLIEIGVKESAEENILSFYIKDNGCGMSPETVARVTDPFTTSRTTRKVGLGIPLTKLACEQAGGGFEISSKEGVGTELHASFVYDSIDRQPLGDMATTIWMTVVNHKETDFLYIHKVEDKEFTLDTRELKKVLGGVTFDVPEVSAWIREYIRENIDSLYNKEGME